MKTMKIKTLLYSFASLAAGVLLASCNQKEEPGEAKAVGASESYVIFKPVEAPEQTISVYADGSWAVDVDKDWITVSPMTGEGMGSITISVTDNMTGGVMDSPREGIITLQGRFRERRMLITVHQDGDNYYGVEEMTLAQVAALEDDSFAKIPNVQVMGLSKGGFIVTDESASLYVKGTGPALGDIIALNGKKIKVNDAPAFELDEFEVKEKEEVVYPKAKDITDILPTYDKTVTEYVSLSASLVGTDIWVSTSVKIPILDPLESLGLAALDLHKVVYKGYGVGASMLVTSVEDGGMDEALIPYPLKFKVRVDDINYTTESWAEDSRIDPVNGLGYIEYVPYDLANTDPNSKYVLDVSDKSPRVTGPWPGDYWLFYGNGAIKAGSEVHIAFEARTSATGHKFWMLEFLDGQEWRPACETFTTSDPGEEVIYTHAMNADGATNVKADCIVKYRKNSEHAQFRFRCMANWQASGAGALAARNGGSARLTVTDKADPTYQPTIEIVKEGDGVEKDPVYAEIEVSTDLLTFNGTPGDPKTITVTSDHDFTVTTPADWLSFDVTEGLAGEPTEIKVTCAQSELPELRQSTIKIVSEDSEKVINVVQSAAGQQLDPFISLSKGNFATVKHAGGEVKVKVQANVEFEMETSGEWITAIPANTKGLVEWTDVLVNVAENDSNGPRTGTVRFYNTEAGVETILNISQEYEEPIVENNLIQWGFSADLMAAYKEAFEQNNAFDANVEGKGTLSWHDLVENVAADTDAKKSHLIGGTGQPYVTGVFPGDYWQFTIPVVDVAAGTVVRFQGLHRVSGTGQKYWRMDWSLDGTNWTPVKELQTETETGTSAQYTHVAPTSDVLVDETFKLADGVTGKGSILIRFTCAANWQANGKGALAKPNGGTHRWSGAAENGPKITLDQPHDPLKAQWLFSAEAMADAETGYAATFGGTTAVNVKEAGDGGLYVNSNVTKGGKIRYFQVDKTVVDEGNKAARLVGGTGHPYVQGAWPGDYWLFEANDGYTYPAGTKVHIYFQTRLSGTGHKYWKLEYWDGAAWQPVSALQETTVGTGEAAQTFQYNFEPSTDSKNNSVIDFTWTLAADCSNMQFRYTCMANWQANGKGALANPNGGTCRIAGDATTSPVFEVVVED